MGKYYILGFITEQKICLINSWPFPNLIATKIFIHSFGYNLFSINNISLSEFSIQNICINSYSCYNIPIEFKNNCFALFKNIHWIYLTQIICKKAKQNARICVNRLVLNCYQICNMIYYHEKPVNYTKACNNLLGSDIYYLLIISVIPFTPIFVT